MVGDSELIMCAIVFHMQISRCDSSVDGTGGIDLTTSAEKHTIHSFVEKCLTRLKEGDRQLPQASDILLPPTWLEQDTKKSQLLADSEIA